MARWETPAASRRISRSCTLNEQIDGIAEEIGKLRVENEIADAAEHQDGLNQTLADGVPHEARGFVDFELLHQTSAVRFGGLGAEAQRDGHLFRRIALRDELEHLAFACR